MDALVNLEELWLGKNKLQKLEVYTTSTFIDLDTNFETSSESGQTHETQNSVTSVESYYQD